MSTTTQLPLGVAAILEASSSSPYVPTALSQFTLPGRVAMISGAHRGIGLEMALALAEAGAIVYCLDLQKEPDQDWKKVQSVVEQFGSLSNTSKKARLEYVSADVTNQKEMWDIGESIAQKEQRLDICVANAGILGGQPCLEYDGEAFKKLLDVNVNGALFTAQAAGRQMERLGIKGSIIFTASMSGTIANKGHPWVAYNTSKSAVLQMARSMACELGTQGIRVNTISPGVIYTRMTKNFLDQQPHLMKEWSSQNPLSRLGRPDELRGAVTWLASDASTFCTGSDIIVDGGHRAW